MTDNKTSAAVREETNLAPRYRAICEKYLKMEEALHNALLNCVDDGSDPQSPHYTIVCEAVDDLEEALSFDPLND